MSVVVECTTLATVLPKISEELGWPLTFCLCFYLLQDTLAYATALLNEKEQSGSSNGSESSPANENGERHLQQGSESPMMIGELRSDLDDVDP